MDLGRERVRPAGRRDNSPANGSHPDRAGSRLGEGLGRRLSQCGDQTRRHVVVLGQQHLRPARRRYHDRPQRTRPGGHAQRLAGRLGRRLLHAGPDRGGEPGPGATMLKGSWVSPRRSTASHRSAWAPAPFGWRLQPAATTPSGFCGPASSGPGATTPTASSASAIWTTGSVPTPWVLRVTGRRCRRASTTRSPSRPTPASGRLDMAATASSASVPRQAGRASPRSARPPTGPWSRPVPSLTGAVGDGTLWTWGNNLKGQLGLGDMVDRNVPASTGFKVDVTGPVTTALKKVTVRKGALARLRYRVNDEFSRQATGVKIVLKRAGKTIKTFSLGTRQTGKQYVKAFRAPARHRHLPLERVRHRYGRERAADRRREHAQGHLTGRTGRLTYSAAGAALVRCRPRWSLGTAWATGEPGNQKYESRDWRTLMVTCSKARPRVCWLFMLADGLVLRVMTAAAGAARPMLAAGGGHTLILRSDGTLWSAGLNSSGQLGVGDQVDRSTFRRSRRPMAGATRTADSSTRSRSSGMARSGPGESIPTDSSEMAPRRCGRRRCRSARTETG